MAVRYRRQGLGRELTLGFGGEVTLGGLIDQSLPQSVPDPAALAQMRQARRHHPLLRRGMRTAEVWGDCVGVLQANVTALSLTSPLTMHSQRARTAGEPQLPPRSQAQSQSQQQQQQQQQQRSVVEAKRAHPLQVECLVDANVDVVSLANGQSMGFQEEGLLDTWEALETAGVAHAGSGEDRQTALRPAILHSLGRRLAYFSISAAGGGLRDASGLELWAAAPRRAGIAHFDLSDQGSCDETLRELQEAIEALKASVRVSFVVVSVCWGAGPIARGAIPTRMRAFCRALVDRAGADIVHGHGLPHFLGVEVYKGKPLLYSLGGLLSDRLHAPRPLDADRALADALGDPSLGPARPEQRPDLSLFARVVVRPTGDLGWVELHPLHCRMLQVNRAQGKQMEWAVATFCRLCRDLGVRAVPSREGVRIRLSAKPPAEPPRPRSLVLRSPSAAAASVAGAKDERVRAGGRLREPKGGRDGDDDDDEDDDSEGGEEEGLRRRRRRARHGSAFGIGGGDDSGGLPSSLVSLSRSVGSWLQSAVGAFVGSGAGGSGGGDGGSGGGGSGGVGGLTPRPPPPLYGEGARFGVPPPPPLPPRLCTTPPQASSPATSPTKGSPASPGVGLGLGLGSPSRRWLSSPRRSPGRSPGGSNWSPIGGGGGSDARWQALPASSAASRRHEARRGDEADAADDEAEDDDAAGVDMRDLTLLDLGLWGDEDEDEFGGVGGGGDRVVDAHTSGAGGGVASSQSSSWQPRSPLRAPGGRGRGRAARDGGSGRGGANSWVESPTTARGSGSPGVRRGGRLDSPSSPAAGYGGGSDDALDLAEEDGEQIPLSELLQGLNGGR